MIRLKDGSECEIYTVEIALTKDDARLLFQEEVTPTREQVESALEGVFMLGYADLMLKMQSDVEAKIAALDEEFLDE